MMPRTWVWAGGAVLVGSLCCTAFLLGRLSAVSEPVAVVAPAPAPQAPASPQVVAPTAADAGTPAEVEDPPVETTAAPTSEPAPSTVATAEAPSPSAAPSNPAVERYLSALDRLDTSGIDTNPQAYAQQLMMGDTSGLDRLLAEHEARAAAISALRPPPEARRHHAALVELATLGTAVIRKLRDGVARQDLGALMSLQSDAARIQALGHTTEQLEAELRQRVAG